MSDDMTRNRDLDGSRDDSQTEAAVDRYVFTPPIDIYETDEGLGLQADLPGVCIDTLELQVQDNKLTLFVNCRRRRLSAA